MCTSLGPEEYACRKQNRTNLGANIIRCPALPEKLPEVKWYHITDANSPKSSSCMTKEILM